MYDSRGFELPGTPGGAPRYLAQHDFVHVLADYGTNLKGELEVFAFIGRADPDPKGFAWLATLIGLFETGYIPTTGFFDRNVGRAQRPGAGHAPRGWPTPSGAARWCAEANGVDLFEVDYYAAGRTGRSTRCGRCSGSRPSRPARSRRVGRAVRPRPACRSCSGRSYAERRGAIAMNPNFSQTITVRCDDPARDHRPARRSGTWPRPRATSWATWASRLLADRDDPGRYLIIADFGVIDPDVSAADEAERNNRAARDPGVRGPPARAGRRRARVPPLRRALPHRLLRTSPGVEVPRRGIACIPYGVVGTVPLVFPERRT